MKLILSLLAFALYAADAPAIDYKTQFKAEKLNSDLFAMKMEMDAKQKELTAAIEEMRKACGNAYELRRTDEWRCIAKDAPK